MVQLDDARSRLLVKSNRNLLFRCIGRFPSVAISLPAVGRSINWALLELLFIKRLLWSIRSSLCSAERFIFLPQHPLLSFICLWNFEGWFFVSLIFEPRQYLWGGAEFNLISNIYRTVLVSELMKVVVIQRTTLCLEVIVHILWPIMSVRTVDRQQM